MRKPVGFPFKHALLISLTHTRTHQYFLFTMLHNYSHYKSLSVTQPWNPKLLFEVLPQPIVFVGFKGSRVTLFTQQEYSMENMLLRNSIVLHFNNQTSAQWRFARALVCVCVWLCVKCFEYLEHLCVLYSMDLEYANTGFMLWSILCRNWMIQKYVCIHRPGCRNKKKGIFFHGGHIFFNLHVSTSGWLVALWPLLQ